MGSNKEVRAAIVRQAESFVTEADEAPKALTKLHWIEKALETYQQLGDHDKVDELKRLLSQVGLETVSDMNDIAVDIVIPRELVEGWVNQLLTLDLKTALDSLGQMERFVPQMERVRAEARALRQRHPIQFLVSRRTLDSAGRTVQQALAETEQIASSEASTYNLSMTIGNLQLGLAFDRLESEMGLTAELFMCLLRSKPIFESNTLGVVSVGVERYFAKDYASALHILVPQLEETLRDILSKIGISRTSVQFRMAFRGKSPLT